MQHFTENVLCSLIYRQHGDIVNLWTQYAIYILHKIPILSIRLFPQICRYKKPLVTNNGYQDIYSFPAPSCGRVVYLRYVWVLVVSFFEYAINTSEQLSKLFLRSLWIEFRASNGIRFALFAVCMWESSRYVSLVPKKCRDAAGIRAMI